MWPLIFGTFGTLRERRGHMRRGKWKLGVSGGFHEQVKLQLYAPTEAQIRAAGVPKHPI